MDDAHVRMARAGLKMEVRQLATATGVEKNTISRIENRQRLVDPETEAALKSFFGGRMIFVSEDELKRRYGSHGAGVILRRGEGIGSWKPEELPSRDIAPPEEPGGLQTYNAWRDNPEGWRRLGEEGRVAQCMLMWGFVPAVDPFEPVNEAVAE